MSYGKKGNGFLDKIYLTQTDTPIDAAKKLQLQANMIVRQMTRFLETAKDAVADHTQSGLVAAIGSEASDMLAFHQKVKTFLADTAPDVDAPNLTK